MADLFSWQRLIQNFPILIVKLPITFEIVAVAFTLGFLLALLIATARIKKIPVLNQILTVFISFERGTPLLVQMLVVYYALPIVLKTFFGIDSRRWEKIIFVDLALILNQGVFLGEIFRGAILSIPKGQREAAIACGFSEFNAFVRIVLPQAVRVALPSTGLTLIGLFQETSLVFMIGVIDIIGRASALGATTGHSLESYVIIAVIFVLINFVLTAITTKIDKKLTFGAKPVRMGAV
ncbi:amino acid ABC transporter permease [Treponema ruminis]|uniref:His/Glu/Gln/Arg/opine family amino acid ABC transporter permease subunit n=1 Tax=Treponema ruminis TaxID=744515 RepID=A0A7W8G8U6_9SPIR|nr:amino acid ABC transporter permease [Treponema ruminis]MBB5225975.1 His/Glu/Gln/Arg/opine family amino acid ABC transporter permease subunit [Treponema ruminis]QSI03114.1 amino acid ABC transporter permease [Treponema ruminis]